MTDEQEFTGDLTQEAITEGMKQAARELHDWISGGNFEQDIRRRGVQIARERAEGVYRSKVEQDQLERTFKPDTDLREVERANSRLSELLAKGHLSKSEEAERVKLTKVVEAGLKRYSSPSSKKWRE